MKKIFIFFFLLLLTFLQTKLYLHSGFPYTHDGENHLVRFLNYKVALREGQFPPRFAPNLLNHYGYPVFNFNYPLANILSLPFSFLKLNPEVTFKLLVTVAVFLGLLYCYKWLREHFSSEKARIMGVSVFALSPFLTSAIYFRGNIGEILGYLFLPYLFFSINQIKKTKKVQWRNIVGFSLFLLSHNLTVVFALPILLGYSMIIFKKRRKLWKIWLFQWFMAFLFSAWFWIPALLEKGQTVVDQVNLVKEFDQHFITVQQLLFSPTHFGYSMKGPIDSFGFSIGILSVISLLIGIPLFIKQIFQRKVKKRINFNLFFFFLTLSLLLFFLQLHWSGFIWGIFPFLHIIQFPWRLTLFALPSIAFMTAFIIEEYKNDIFLFYLFFFVVQTVLTFVTQPVDYFHKNTIDYELFSQTTSTQNENRAKTFTYQGFADWEPSPTLTPESGRVEVHLWNGTNRNYTLQLNQETTVIEPTMYFSGWETWGKEKGKMGKWKKVEYILDNRTQGRIAYRLPVGEYEVETRFTQNTLPRIVGNSLFIVGVLITSGVYFRGRKLHS